MTRTLPKVWDTMREVNGELRKITWPSRAEVLRSTRIVLAMLLLLCTYFASVDALLDAITRMLGLLP